MLWGKTNKVRTDLHLLGDICEKGIEDFIEAVKQYSTSGITPMFLATYEEVCQHEKEADQQVFLITQELYSDFLLPVSREDLARLVHQCDSILDMAQKSLKLIVTRRILLSDESFTLVSQLLNTTQECVTLTIKALKLLMGPRNAEKMRTLTQEIGNLETLCDTYQEQLITQIFTPKHQTISMLLQSDLIDTIGSISDACENTAVIMSIMTVKRIA